MANLRLKYLLVIETCYLPVKPDFTGMAEKWV
jgi:hypothetical protein